MSAGAEGAGMITQLIKTTLAVVMLSDVVVAATPPDRNWQTGSWTQVGINRTVFVADIVHERMPPDRNVPQKTEVARYVIDTEDRRYELQDMVAIGSNELARVVKIGDPVTFAVEKKTA